MGRIILKKTDPFTKTPVGTKNVIFLEIQAIHTISPIYSPLFMIPEASVGSPLSINCYMNTQILLCEN